MANRHGKRLMRSTADDVVLCNSVTIRFLKLCETYTQTRGVRLIVPPSMDRDFLHWREMAVRHRCKKLKPNGKRCESGSLAYDPVQNKLLAHDKNHMPLCGECGGQGDYRHREVEMRSLRAIAQWTMDVKTGLQGKLAKIIEWEGD